VLVEIFSDVICPWCYIGKRRFEAAREAVGGLPDMEVRWRAFELDPNAPPRRSGPTTERVARKYGISVEQARAAHARLTEMAAAEGLDYHLESTCAGNTFDAHRLVHLAAAAGLDDALHERLLRAYLCESRPVGEPEVLRELAVEVGLGPDEVEATLAGDAFTAEVRADERRAQDLDIYGVPAFVFDEKLVLQGAQATALFTRVLQKLTVGVDQSSASGGTASAT
jgi:predicted DsbA family dithiol-disulfide isomerase